MALKLSRTSDYNSASINMLVYGYAGSGKTTLATTCDAPIILGAEPGIVSIRHHDLPVADGIEGTADLDRFIEGIAKSTKYKTIVIDSLTRVAMIVLDQYLGAKTSAGNKANGMQAYGEMAQYMLKFVQKLRDLPQDTVWLCQQAARSDEISGGIKYGPRFPGNVLPDSVHYEADIVARLCNQASDNKVVRWLRLQGDDMHEGKNWFGGTDANEPAHIGKLFQKIRSGNQ